MHTSHAEGCCHGVTSAKIQCTINAQRSTALMSTLLPNRLFTTVFSSLSQTGSFIARYPCRVDAFLESSNCINHYCVRKCGKSPTLSDTTGDDEEKVTFLVPEKQRQPVNNNNNNNNKPKTSVPANVVYVNYHLLLVNRVHRHRLSFPFLSPDSFFSIATRCLVFPIGHLVEILSENRLLQKFEF